MQPSLKSFLEKVKRKSRKHAIRLPNIPRLLKPKGFNSKNMKYLTAKNVVKISRTCKKTTENESSASKLKSSVIRNPSENILNSNNKNLMVIKKRR